MADKKPGFGFDEIKKALAALVAAGLVAFVYWIALQLFPNALPALTAATIGGIAFVILILAAVALALWRRAIRYWQTHAIPAAKGDRIAFVVARLGADQDGHLTHRVVLSLQEQLGKRIEVIPIDEMFTLGERGNTERRQLEFAEKGRALLKRTGGDVLIWGMAMPDEHVIDLNFLSKDRDTHTDETRSYALSQTMRLPENFGQDLGTALAAVAVSAAAPAIKDAGRYLVPVLKPVVARLAHLVDAPPASLVGNSKAQIFHAYAVACVTIGEQAGDSAMVEKAVTAFREALKEYTRERVPLDWAMTQNNLGNALLSLGERESGTARLEEAVSAYREALKEYTRERVPLDWAMTQNNLGNALSTLGERESGTARLTEAVAAYREALKERTRERVPLQWATTQNNLGTALSTLGERESGTARLEEAVAAYREALKERTRERVPLQWAATQNNLGNALSRLGERESGTARLEEAVAAFREALSVLEDSSHTYLRDMARRNLARAEALLAERRKGEN